jgi:cobaltochelatase CobT
MRAPIELSLSPSAGAAPEMNKPDAPLRSTILKKDAKGVVRHGAEWLALWSDPEALKSAEERRQDRDEGERRARRGRQLSAAARALSGDPHMSVDLGGQADSQGFSIDPRQLSAANMPGLRGDVDSRALFLRYHDAAIHAAQAPADEDARRLFDLCELVRCETRGALRLPGIGDNLVAAHMARLERFDLLSAHLASLIPLAEALRMVVRDTLVGAREPSIASSGFWMWDRWLRARLAPELADLERTADDQESFAASARRFIAACFEVLQGQARGPARRATSPSDGGDRDRGEEDAASEPSDGADSDSFEPSAEIFADDDETMPQELLEALADLRPPAYGVHTTAHDRVVGAETLGDPRSLREARTRLDARRAEYRRDLSRLVTQLQRRLMALQTRSWIFDLEEGLIDASRLDRVVVNPGFSDAYKQEEESQFRDTAVTLLLDNSGSMRGKPIEIACVVSDMIAAALEQCGVTTEILGFTTSGWKGGKAAADWARAGKPANPGRLNDLLHIVYKSADESLRRVRNNLCVMLSNDLLKENIDGEALLWASRRLAVRSEVRKVLIVISDGAPVDQATLENNDDKQILDRHLRQTIAAIQKGGQIELAAIGIKHEVGQYYDTAIQVDRVEELGKSLIRLIDALVVR